MSRTLSIRLQNISRAYYDINKKPWNWTWLGHSLCVNLGSITLETWLPHITLSRKDTFSKDLWGFKEKNSLTSLNWLTRHLLYSIMSIGSGHSNGKAQVQEMYTYAKSIHLFTSLKKCHVSWAFEVPKWDILTIKKVGQIGQPRFGRIFIKKVVHVRTSHGLMMEAFFLRISWS